MTALLIVLALLVLGALVAAAVVMVAFVWIAAAVVVGVLRLLALLASIRVERPSAPR